MTVDPGTVQALVHNYKQRLTSEQQGRVRIALFGPTGAGKSSLINAMVGAEVAKPGIVQMIIEPTTFTYGDLDVVDLPGFDAREFPVDTFEDRFKIEQYDVLLCCCETRFAIQATQNMFTRARARSKAAIIVRTKSDGIYQKGHTVEELKAALVEDARKCFSDPSVNPVFVSSRTGEGMDELQKAIAGCLSDARRERWYRSAKAYSEEFLARKREACSGKITAAALLSAANAFNPIPGADAGIDLAILVKLFKELRVEFGLGEDVSWIGRASPDLAGKASEIAGLAVGTTAAQAFKSLLKRFAGREAAKEFSKWIPIAGQGVAAGIGYALTSNAGKWYLAQCEELARELLKRGLEVPESAFQSSDDEALSAQVSSKNFLLDAE